MKKFLYVALMAIVTFAFSACKSNFNGSDYYTDGRQVVVDYNKCTVNGVKYDNTTEKCWMWTLKEKTGGAAISLDYYVWCTEFVLAVTCETEMYECSRSGRIAEYAYIQAPSYKSADACEQANNH
jgi:hypothetical protein